MISRDQLPRSRKSDIQPTAVGQQRRMFFAIRFLQIDGETRPTTVWVGTGQSNSPSSTSYSAPSMSIFKRSMFLWPSFSVIVAREYAGTSMTSFFVSSSGIIVNITSDFEPSFFEARVELQGTVSCCYSPWLKVKTVRELAAIKAVRSNWESDQSQITSTPNLFDNCQIKVYFVADAERIDNTVFVQPLSVEPPSRHL